MSEHWETIIERELNFLYHAPEYEAELKELLYENEMNIQYPVTRFDEEEGRVYLQCPGTEEQALRRIEKREALESGLKRLYERANRLKKALNQLNEDEQDLIGWFYLERDGTPESFTARTLGFKGVKEFREKKKEILCKLLKIYENERLEQDKEFRRTREKQRKELISNWLKHSNKILESCGDEVNAYPI